MNPPEIEEQSRYWDQWNSRARADSIPIASTRQWQAIEPALRALHQNKLRILDIGCGTGWTCERLLEFGNVTGIDFAPEIIIRAKRLLPQATFVCGDLFTADLPLSHFDVLVCFEVLAHIADQAGFVERIDALLKPRGRLFLTTQNRPVYERWSCVSPPDPAQIRNWINAAELRCLLEARFSEVRISSVFPAGDLGFLRIVNSSKLNRLLGSILSEQRVTVIKERAMLGKTLVAIATKA